MGNITYKDLYTQVLTLIEKKQSFYTPSKYQNQLNTSIAPDMGNFVSDSVNAELVESIYSIFAEALPPWIITGLIVEADSPISNQVTVSAGKGTVGGKLYELDEESTLVINFDDNTHIFYISLYENALLVEREKDARKLTIAKIVVPMPGITDRIIDTKDDDSPWDAYIQNFTEYKLYGDGSGKLEEDSIEILKDNIGDVLGSTIIGNITLSENLKIVNTAGTLELNSDSLQFFDFDLNLIMKLNDKGAFFYNAYKTELARFTANDARIGNIQITKNSLESVDFASGTGGFQIKDNGDVEFNDGTFRGTLEASSGVIGGWTITSTSLYGTTTGSIKTGINVGAGYNGVILDQDGLRVYDAVLGVVADFPSDGSPPSISSGTIREVVYEITTNAVMRTAETVGDGGSASAGILINNTGIYGCGSFQTLNDANFKVLRGGDAYFKGELNATSGQIGGFTISSDTLTGGTVIGATLRGTTIENKATFPKIRWDSSGMSYQVTTSVGKYGEFEYGLVGAGGKLYGAGVLAYIFNEDEPILSVKAEHTRADIRFYNRGADPSNALITDQIGDVIVVNGQLKLCTTAGGPGTFSGIYMENSECENFIIDNRTSDPGSPVTGQMWLRTDI